MQTHPAQLQIYLRNLHWEAQHYTSQELETMMGAALLRYLHGLTEIAFVLGLAEAIQLKLEDNTRTSPLPQALHILHHLTEAIEVSSVLPMQKQMVDMFIAFALESLLPGSCFYINQGERLNDPISK